MIILRRLFIAFIVVLFLPPNAKAAQPDEILSGWYKLVLALVRHTPTYSPPVASRSFAYLGVTGFEAVASGSPHMHSLAGQLNGLAATPKRETGKVYDDAVVLDAALEFSAKNFFSNTGPTGQHALNSVAEKLAAKSTEGVAADIVARSQAYGQLIAQQVFNWSNTDGGAVVENMGFPMQYDLTKGPAHWVPTSLISQQQLPLLPNWGKNRPFAMPSGTSCGLPAPPEYSEDKNSVFYKQALEVLETKANLTPAQKDIARFWSDDPMLSPTPPGHWISIAMQIFEHDHVDVEKSVDVLARLGIAEADAFIGCWNVKYQYDLLRPVTYIRRMMDPKWESLLITPPFPEYPSGHSTQSGAAAMVLSKMFGDHYAFQDATRQRDGLTPRQFSDFWAAAQEAAVSRLYGGIHFRAAIEQGLEQGRCIGQFASALQTRN
jgi:PAP2 superfamily